MGPCSDLWHQYWVGLLSTTLRQSLIMKVEEPRKQTVRCGPGTSLSRCMRATTLPTDWQPKEPKCTNILNETVKKISEVSEI